MKLVKINADKLLYNFGLLNELNKYGKTHIIGSYLMNLMVWNDLDIDVENNNISMNSIYILTKYILDTFAPVWFEGKKTIMNDKECYFVGFETEVLGELWNVDIWFFDKVEIAKCEEYCNEVNEKIGSDESLQKTIINIKRELILQGMYNSQYNSVDVYDAVLNHNVKTVDDLICRYKPNK